MPNEIVTVEATAAGAIAASEVDQQVSTARRFPRSEAQFYSRAKAMILASEETATECIYALPRGGKTIEGPSVRMAEALAYAWGNNRVAARVLGLDETGRFIVAQGVFHDLETNIARSVEIRRRITTRSGAVYDDDMIGVTANAAASVAMREATLKGIPRAVWGEIYAQARALVTGTIEGMDRRRDAAVKAFQLAGLSQDIMLKIAGRRGLKDIEPNDLITLRGVLVAIRDGDTSANSLIREFSDESNGGQKLTDKPDISGRLRQAQPEPKAEAKADPKAEPAKSAQTAEEGGSESAAAGQPAQPEAATADAPAKGEGQDSGARGWTDDEAGMIDDLGKKLNAAESVDTILEITREMGPRFKGQSKALVMACNNMLEARRQDLSKAKKTAAGAML